MAGLDANTKLLTHFNGGANGSLEIKDEAQVPHIYTEVGTAQLVQNSLVKRFGKGSLLLDGNSDYISIPDHNDWDFPGDFTIECWFKWNTVGANQYIMGLSYVTGWALKWSGANWQFFMDNGIRVQGAPGFTHQINTWYHLAVSRNGTSLQLYLDGNRIASATYGTAVADNTALNIGKDVYGGSQYWNGYFDEVRITKGTYRYDGASFVPPDAPFVSDANTVLLLHMDTMQDSGNTDHTADITYFATAQNTNWWLYGKGSLDFNGSTSYIEYADHNDWDFPGDFTVECWFQWDSYSIDQYLLGTSFQTGWALKYDSVANGFIFFMDNVGRVSSPPGYTLTSGVWHHIAVSRNGTNLQLYLDGVRLASATYGTAVADTIALNVGRSITGATQYWNGKMEEVRITKGTYRYDGASFTLPSAPFTSDANTVLLLHGNYNGYDSGNTGHVPTSNTINVTATAIERFGNSSLYFDGDSDYLTSPDSDYWDIVKTTGSMTLDFWVKHDDHAGNERYAIHYQDGTHFWMLRHVAGTGIEVFVFDGSLIIQFSGGEIIDSMWHHIALIRVVDDWQIYKDGVAVANAQNENHNQVMTGLLGVGGLSDGDFLDGLIDELRLTYSNPFGADPTNGSDTITVPTSAYTADSATTTLLHCDSYDVSRDGGRDADKTHVSKLFGTAQIDAGPVRVFGQGCADFNGTTGYIAAPDSTDWDIVATTGAVTLDFWVKHDDHVGNERYLIQFQNNDNYWMLRHVHGSGIQLLVVIANVVQINFTGGEITDTDWHHIALIRVLDDWQLYKDGVAVVNAQNESHTQTNAGLLGIGSHPNSLGDYFDGHMDEIRIEPSNIFSADPTSSTDTITVPSAPYTATGSTSLLLHMNDSLDSGDTGHTMTWGNGAITSGVTHTGLSRWNDGAMDFDGAGDYLQFLTDADWNFGTGAFSIEFWLRPEANVAAFPVSCSYQTGWGIQYDASNGDMEFWAENVSRCKIDGTVVSEFMQLGVWKWVVVARDGSGNISMYYNGVRLGTAIDSIDINPSLALRVGTGVTSSTQYVNGQIDGLKIAKGTDSGYSGATITIPTSAPTSDGNTSLLLQGDIDFTDTSSNAHTNTPTGNVTITAWKRFGTGSIYYSGAATDYITMFDSSPDWDIFKTVADNWTIDFWYKADLAIPGHNEMFYTGPYQSGTYHWYMWRYVTTGLLYFRVRPASIVIEDTSSVGILDSAWHHVALIKVADEYAFYLDGNQVSYVQDTSVAVFRGVTYIGQYGGLGAFELQGHLDEFRIQNSNYFNAVPVVGETDTITVPTEEYGPDTTLAISIFDTVTTDDVTTENLLTGPQANIFDTVTLNDVTAQDNPLPGVSIFDTVSVDDDVIQVVEPGAFQVEQLFIRDVVATDLPLAGVSIFDTVTFNDVITAGTIISALLIDNITLDDDVTQTLPLGPVSIFDTVTTTDVGLWFSLLPGFVFDTVTIGETDFEDIPSFGVVQYKLGMDKVYYSGKTATTFTGCIGAIRHDTAMYVRGDVVASSGCPFCGTYNWDGAIDTRKESVFTEAHPSKGYTPIPNDSVTHGWNAEYPTYPEGGFLKCNKCSYTMNRYRHPRGWGDGITQVYTQLTAAVAPDDSTIYVGDTTGFPDSGYIYIYEVGHRMGGDYA